MSLTCYPHLNAHHQIVFVSSKPASEPSTTQALLNLHEENVGHRALEAKRQLTNDKQRETRRESRSALLKHDKWMLERQCQREQNSRDRNDRSVARRAHCAVLPFIDGPEESDQEEEYVMMDCESD